MGRRALPVATFLVALGVSIRISRRWLWEKVAFDKAMLPSVTRFRGRYSHGCGFEIPSLAQRTGPRTPLAHRFAMAGEYSPLIAGRHCRRTGGVLFIKICPPVSCFTRQAAASSEV